MATRANYSFQDTPTIADWNTYILNGGLVYLANYEFASASQLGITYAFSYPATQFRNYRIVISNLLGATAGVLFMRMMDGESIWASGSYLTAYSSARRTAFSDNASPTTGVLSGGAAWAPVSIDTLNPTNLIFDIINPNFASRTTFHGRGGSLGNNLSTFAGQLSVTDVFSGIALTGFGAGNISCNAEVYGYRTET